MIPTRKEMYQEIFRRFQIHKSNEPYLSNMDIIKRVCAEKAPSFYLTPQSIHVILSRVRRRRSKDATRYEREDCALCWVHYNNVYHFSWI